MGARGQDKLSSLTQAVSLVEMMTESETLQLHALLESRLRTVFNRTEYSSGKSARAPKSAPKTDGKTDGQRKAESKPKTKSKTPTPSPLGDVPVFKEYRHNERLVREQTKERGARSKVDKEVMAASAASSVALFWHKQDKALAAAIEKGTSPAGTIMVDADGAPASEGLRVGRLRGLARHFNEAVNFFGSTEEAMKNTSMSLAFKALRRGLSEREILDAGAADPDAGWTKPKKSVKPTPPGSPKSGGPAGPSTEAAAADSANRFAPLMGDNPVDWADGDDVDISSFTREAGDGIPVTQPQARKRRRSKSPLGEGNKPPPASKKLVSSKGKGPARV